ncbi:MAG: hypothetical protein RMA76_32305 [Deltaproteobacteria bacterium]|jgi:fluoroquinolone transport system permease protein
MSAATYFRAFARNDVRLVLRERMVFLLLIVSLGMGVGARYLLPVLDESLAANGVLPSATNALRFSDTYEVFVAFIALWQAGLLPGTAFGFVLIEEKEDDTLTVLRVSPAPFSTFLWYRVAVPATIAFVLALVLVPLAGHAPLPFVKLVPLAASTALVAPLTMLLLGSFANDRVQGLAFTKFGGVAGLTILVGWFIPGPWQWLLAAFPPFLTCKAFWLARADDPRWWIAALVAFVLHAGLLMLAVRRLRFD